MVGEGGRERTPYGEAIALTRAVVEPSSELGPYIRGRLHLAGIDLRGDVGSWLDAVYVIIAESGPVSEVLTKLDKQLMMMGGQIYPERESWGLSPRQQQMARGLVDDQDGPLIPRTKRGDGREQ